MQTKQKDLFSSFVDIETKLSDIYMRLATLTEESDFVRVFDKAYYEAVDYKHTFINLKKEMTTDHPDLFSDELCTDAGIIERQLGGLLKASKNLEQSEAYYGLANSVMEVEFRVTALYGRICNEAWENEQQTFSSILARKEARQRDMLQFKPVRSPDKHP